jgi:hydrogenase nickel incorporation protein HypA/HybF
MHEMGIAAQVVQIATDSIPADMAGARVEQVNLKVGKLAAVVPQSLLFCYDIITRDTPLAGSRLHIEEVPVTARCNDCGHDWTVEGPVFRCPECDSGSIQLTSGQELEITSIEIED